MRLALSILCVVFTSLLPVNTSAGAEYRHIPLRLETDVPRPIVVYLMVSDKMLRALVQDDRWADLTEGLNKGRRVDLKKRFATRSPKGVECPYYIGYVAFDEKNTAHFVNKSLLQNEMFDFAIKREWENQNHEYILGFDLHPDVEYRAEKKSTAGVYLFVKTYLQMFADICFVTYGQPPDDDYKPSTEGERIVSLGEIFKEPPFPPGESPAPKIVNPLPGMVPGTSNWGGEAPRPEWNPRPNRKPMW